MVDLRNDSQRARDFRRQEQMQREAAIERRTAMIGHILKHKGESLSEFAQYRRWPKGSRKAVRGWLLGTLHEFGGQQATHATFVLTADGLIR